MVSLYCCIVGCHVLIFVIRDNSQGSVLYIRDDKKKGEINFVEIKMQVYSSNRNDSLNNVMMVTLILIVILCRVVENDFYTKRILIIFISIVRLIQSNITMVSRRSFLPIFLNNTTNTLYFLYLSNL